MPVDPHFGTLLKKMYWGFRTSIGKASSSFIPTLFTSFTWKELSIKVSLEDWTTTRPDRWLLSDLLLALMATSWKMKSKKPKLKIPHCTPNRFQSLHWRIEGRRRRAPQQDPILSFSHVFLPKSVRVGGRQRDIANGKSWIRHWRVWKWMDVRKGFFSVHNLELSSLPQHSFTCVMVNVWGIWLHQSNGGNARAIRHITFRILFKQRAVGSSIFSPQQLMKFNNMRK